eukprot:TRINITY_DN3882_c0_g1_i9.p1 TRINITY_DN3882_c0_g1~~TRINITY_DN3882_c0_g1_i9.p1  ORF type:complete len:196 (-),score=29.19 TRINITY_DN3882_c0_g1_i9:116-703(-)
MCIRDRYMGSCKELYRLIEKPDILSKLDRMKNHDKCELCKNEMKDSSSLEVPCKCKICARCTIEPVLRQINLAATEKNEKIANFECPKCKFIFEKKELYLMLNKNRTFFNFIKCITMISQSKLNRDGLCYDCYAVIPNSEILGKKGRNKEVQRMCQEKRLLNKKLLNLSHLRKNCLLYTSPSPRDLSTSRMPSSA